MHYKFSCPKDPLLLKSVSEKKPCEAKTNCLKMKTDSYLSFSYEQFSEMMEPQIQKKMKRHQDGNPTGVNTVETTFAVFAAKYVLISNEC